jgi:murein DD-endopeptidase MepM/ murein hydrolase activator NlpD
VDTFTGGSRDVFAPEDGTVITVSGDAPPFAGYGPGIVLLKGRSGFYHLLAHLELGSVKVMPGMNIAEGAPIGRFDAAHAHCHYEVRRNPTGPSELNTVDPIAWLESAGGSNGLVMLLLLGGLLAAGYFLARSNVFAKSA